VSSAGAIIEYDFDGDEVDAGLNCYQVDTGALSVIADNRFLVTTDMHANKKFEVELEWLDAGNALKVYFIDENDPAKISSSQIWTRVADESILDDEPPCRR
jgi:carbamoylphosphate synthase large subunit